MYATPDEFAAATRRTLTTEERDWVSARIEEASEFMRTYMGGAHVAPTATTTFTANAVSGYITLPQPYIRSVDAVAVDGSPVAFARHDDTIHVPEAGIRPVTVTFTHGLTRVPADLRGICIGLVSAQMDAMENELGLSIGGLSSIQLDDFKVGFADGGDKTGLYLAEHHQRYLARKYGTTAWVMETRP